MAGRGSDMEQLWPPTWQISPRQGPLGIQWPVESSGRQTVSGQPLGRPKACSDSQLSGQGSVAGVGVGGGMGAKVLLTI